MAKCPYCKGKNLYIKRTWPMEKWGCRDCEKKIAYLRKQELNNNQIKKLFGM